MKETVEQRFDQELSSLEGEIKGKAFFERKETKTDGQKTTTMDVKMDNVNAFLSILQNQQRREIVNTNQNTLRATAVQIKLSDLGYDLGNGKIDGLYGPDTIKAVKAFQKANQLNEDGRAGSETISKLLSENAKKADETEPTTEKDQQDSDSSDEEKDGKKDGNPKAETASSEGETRMIGEIKHKVIRPQTLDEIPTQDKRDKSTPTIYEFGGYVFYSNGRAYRKSDKTTHNTTDILKNEKTTIENKEYKKQNLIKQFELKKFNGSNYFYKREGKPGLYLIDGKHELSYLGSDDGCKKFLGGKADNWRKAEAGSGWRIEALKDYYQLKKDPKIPNTYTREGAKGKYAFDKNGNLYYSGIDHGNKVLKNLSQGDRNNKREDTTIPDALKHIEI